MTVRVAARQEHRAWDLDPDTDGWRHKAACRGADPELFWPTHYSRSAAAAKRVCGPCEVKAQCLAEAIDNGEREGVWGGENFGSPRGPGRIDRATCPHCKARVPISKGRRLWLHPPGVVKSCPGSRQPVER